MKIALENVYEWLAGVWNAGNSVSYVIVKESISIPLVILNT